MKSIRLVKSKMANGDFHLSNNVIRSQKELLHEHDFIPVAVKGLNRPLIRCVTCGKYYCEFCGKALTDREMQYLFDTSDKLHHL
jgi:hypothetical protein